MSASAFYNRHKRWLPAAVRRWISLARLRAINEPVIAYHVLQGHARARTMIDVGAAHGSALKIFAADGWRVWACEPNPENRAVLERWTARYPRVTVWPYALSDQREDGVTFYTSSVSSGLGSLKPFDESHRPGFTVDVRTLAELFPDPPVIDFLKIDTEGYDLWVLKGMPWDRMQPRLILCEYDNHKSIPLGYRMEDMADFLQQQGYRVWVSASAPIADYGTLPAWRGFYPYGERKTEDDSTGNLFAAEPSLEPHLARRLRQFERAYRARS